MHLTLSENLAMNLTGLCLNGVFAHLTHLAHLAHLSLLKAIWSYFYAIFISVFLRIMLQFQLQSKQMSQQTKLCVVILTSSSAFNLASSSVDFCSVSISACILVSSLASTATLIFRWSLGWQVKAWLISSPIPKIKK